MARAPVREVSAPSRIQPVASPVDAYVRPADPPRSQLWDIANGLGALAEGVSALGSKRSSDQANLDKIRGEAAFNRDHAASWGEAVASGLVPANASPIFQESWKRAQGNLAGIQLRDKFRSAYMQWDGRNLNDPGAYDAFVAGFLKENLGAEQDPYVLSGLNPHVEALYSEGYEVFGKESADAVYGGAVSTQGALVGETIQAHETSGLASETGTDYDALWGQLEAQRSEALASGMRTKDWDDQYVAAVVAEATRTGNAELLGQLDRKIPGTEHTYASMPDYRTKRDAALEALDARQRQVETDESRRKKAEDDARKDSIYVGIARALADDPNANVSEETIRELERYEPDARKKIIELKKSIQSAGEMEDPKTIIELYEKIRLGATAEDIAGWKRQGLIRDSSTYTAMLDRSEKYAKARTEGSGILSSQTAKRFANAIKERTAEDTQFDIFGTRGLSAEGLQATQDFEFALMEWEAANPNANAMDREKAINDIGQMILGRTDQDTRTYTSPEDAKRAEQKAAAEEEQAVEDAKESGAGLFVGEERFDPSGDGPEDTSSEPDPTGDVGAAPEWLKKAYTGDKPPAIDTLPQEQQDFIKSESERLGVDPEEYHMAFWAKMKQTLLGNKDETDKEFDAFVDPTTTNSIPNEAGDKITDLLRNPPTMRTSSTASSNPDIRRAAPLLDLFGKSEGTDKGRGYNETLGYGAYTGGDVELTGMTLNELDALQTKMLKHPNNKWNSSAAGRYQIVRTTVRKLRKSMGLSGDELYDEDMQDRMAVALLEGRGYSKFLAGKMSETAFLNNLAKEWASVPTASGRGFYGNQAKTPITPAEVKERFAAILSGGYDKEQYAGVGGDVKSMLDKMPAAYRKIPAAEVAQFVQWNSDPVANNETNLQSVEPKLADVVRLAQTKAKVKFVVGSGKRDAALQKKAIEWGWSHKEDSDHLHGGAVDLWPLDQDDAVVFKDSDQKEIVRAMVEAAKELGVKLDVGFNWKNKDKPHFALKA